MVKDLGEAMQSVNPGAYLVGEDWSFAPDWVGPGRFDSLMNYAIGRDVILRYVRGRFSFMRGHWALGQLSKIYAAYPVATAAMGFNDISTHDTSRLLTELGGTGLSGQPTAVAMKR